MPAPRAEGSPATRVHIFGQPLSIRGTADEGYMQSLSAYVTAHMERLAQASPLTPLPHVAMLAAMNIAHELFELRSRADAREADLDHRTRELLENIDAQFQTAPEPAADPTAAPAAEAAPPAPPDVASEVSPDALPRPAPDPAPRTPSASRPHGAPIHP